MGNLFYNGLGQVAFQSITTTHNANYSLFNNVQSDLYWSGTESSLYTDYAWNFFTTYGYQLTGYKGNNMFTLAVRPGQVSAVPEPESYGLMMAGLGLLGFMVRRKKSA
jgi:hypothetical protein